MIPGGDGTPQRALHVLGQMYRGGAESRTMDLFRNLDRERFVLDFLVMKPGRHHYFDEIEALGGRVFYVEPPMESNFLRFVRDVRGILATEGPFGVVHCHTDFNSGAVMLAARLAGVPVRVVHARTSPPASTGSVRRIYNRAMRRLILSSSTQLVACGTEAGTHLFGKGAMSAGRVVMLPNAIELDRFTMSATARTDARRGLDLDQDCPVVVNVGNLRPVKNQSLLVRAFARLLAHQPEAVLLLVGEGPDEASLKSLVEALGVGTQVRFLGSRDDVPVILAAADLFVMPSLWEGVPGAAVEAQATGLPVLLSDTISREADAGTGLVRFQSLHLSEEQWAATMEEMLAQPRVDPVTVRAAMETSGFDARVNARRLVDLYTGSGGRRG